MTQAMYEQGATTQGTSTASGVAETAKEGVKATAGDAAEQVKSVAGEVKHQVTQLGRQTTDELRTQAEGRTNDAAQGLRTFAGQISALSAGRTEEAGQLLRYLDEGRTKLESFADRLEQRGPQGLMDDVSGFARRRPGMFLLGAIGAGFVVGRMIRANSGQSSNGQNGMSSGSAQAGLMPGQARSLQPSSTMASWDSPSVVRTPNPAIAPDPTLPNRTMTTGSVGADEADWRA